MGYSASDIITILFRVVRNHGGMNEYLKLEYIKVGGAGGEGGITGGLHARCGGWMGAGVLEGWGAWRLGMYIAARGLVRTAALAVWRECLRLPCVLMASGVLVH
jgi:hypothetical protein